MLNELNLIAEYTESSFYQIDLSKEKLNPAYFMGLRTKYYDKNYFYNDPIYAEISERIRNEQCVLILGNPLAGKSRIAYETLASFSKGYLVIPKVDESIKEYILPDKTDLIVYFDELDLYCEKNKTALNKLLYLIFMTGIKCIATCRTGPEFNKIKACLEHNTFTEFYSSKIRIPRFDKKDVELAKFIILNKDRIRNIESFDGNMGSLILPLNDMRERWYKLEEDNKIVPITILRALKFHYHLFNYESRKSYYNESKIRCFCNKYLKDEIPDNEWDGAKKELSSYDATLNFLIEEEFLVIEEAYLEIHVDPDVDVIDGTLTYKKIQKIFKELYKDPFERKSLGFPIHIKDYNAIMQKLETFEERLKILNELPEGIYPDKFTYQLLMQKAENHQTLKDLYEKMKRKGLKTEYTPDSTFIGKFDSFFELLDTLEKYNPKALRVRNNVSARLIKLSLNKPKESLTLIFKKFKPEMIFSSPVLNHICLECCNDEEDFTKYISPFVKHLDSLDKPLVKHFIRICSKLKHKDLSLELLDKYLVDCPSDYFNEKANCIKEKNPYGALYLYAKSGQNANNVIDQAIAYTNFGNLVYDNEIRDKLDLAIKLCNIAIKNKITLSSFPHLKNTYLLLKIWRTPIDKIENFVDIQYKNKDLAKRSFLNIANRIKEKEKKERIISYFGLKKDDKQF